MLAILKFGGTSMGTVEAMHKSAEISCSRNARLVVVSATSGTTNQLIELCQKAEKQNKEQARLVRKAIETRHLQVASEIALTNEKSESLKLLFEEMKALSKGIQLTQECSVKAMDRMLSLGERMSSVLFSHVLENKLKKINNSKKCQLIDAREFIKTDHAFGRAKPLISEIELACKNLSIHNEDIVYVTQGFIGSTLQGETTTLGRGGSDYTAALFAEAVKADVCEIWTDVAGIATTDPRIVPKATFIPEITFQETSELATFGAKVLHPATLVPAIRKNIPVYVANTFSPESGGTWVRKESKNLPLVRAVALRKRQALVTLTTPDMLHAHGFLFNIFKIFNDLQISVDAITTSEISVSMTVDENLVENVELRQKLSQFADVHFDKGFSLVSLIGNNINETAGLAKRIFEHIPDINVRMICLGASKHNFCFLVKESLGEEAVKRLHNEFVE